MLKRIMLMLPACDNKFWCDKMATELQWFPIVRMVASV